MKHGAHTYHEKKMHKTSGANSPSKMEKVMHEFKHGTLHSGSKHGPEVKSRKQAVAIAISEAKRGKKR